MFLQSFSRFVIEADYFINIAYIVKNMCVNTEKPQMHCNGKCYLSKKMKEQAKQEQQVPLAKKVKFDTDLFYTSVIPRLDVTPRYVRIEYKRVSHTKLSTFPTFVFRPPCV